MEFARFVAGAGGISNFVDKRVFIDFPTMFENINTQVTELIAELQQKIQQAENLPIDEDVYSSDDGESNTFTLKFRRQGSIVSLHAICMLQSGAFGQRIKQQLGFPNNLLPEKYKPRENVNARESYIASSGSTIVNLAYVNLNFNENVFYISYCNKDQFRTTVGSESNVFW